MRYRLALALLLILLVLRTSAVQAQEKEFVSNCNAQIPKPAQESTAWLNNMSDHIRRQSHYKRKTKLIAEQFVENELVDAFVRFNNEGNVELLKIEPPQPPALEQMMRDLILNSAPFTSPPKDLQTPSNVVFKFQKKGNSVQLSADWLNRTIHERVGFAK